MNARPSCGSNPAMAYRSLCTALAIALLAGCGTTPDERPATLEVITLEVLAPTCGQVQCHSTTTRTEGFAFDTIDAARESLREPEVRGGRGGELYDVLTADGEDRMPPDSPMNDQDIALIMRWIDDGAPGL